MALVLVLLFIVLPIAEIYVIIKVGEAIGVWPTIALLILDGFLGAALLRHQERGPVPCLHRAPAGPGGARRWGGAGRPADGGSGPAPSSPWGLDSERDGSRLDSIRLVSALFEDGGALGFAAIRPRGARGHDEDVAVTRLIDSEGEPAE